MKRTVVVIVAAGSFLFCFCPQQRKTKAIAVIRQTYMNKSNDSHHNVYLCLFVMDGKINLINECKTEENNYITYASKSLSTTSIYIVL